VRGDGRILEGISQPASQQSTTRFMRHRRTPDLVDR
jgi:hypothetical protein